MCQNTLCSRDILLFLSKLLNYKIKNYITNVISTQQTPIIIDNSNELTFTLNY